MLDTIWLWPLLFVTGLAAGWVGAITGGGGLVVLPVFLLVGFPPHFALGTNMLQSSVGTLAAAYAFIRHQHVNFREARGGIVSTLAGAIGGVVAVHHLDPTMLKNLLPVVLAGIVIYALCSPRLGIVTVQPRMSHGAFYLLAGVTLGFFDGFIGAGAGMLWTMAFVVGLGFDLTKATAYTKVMNATSNVAAFTLFLGYGSVWLAAGLIMALGQVLGGVLGAYVVIKKGAGWVRPLYLTVVILLLLKLIYERFEWVWLKS